MRYHPQKFTIALIESKNYPYHISYTTFKPTIEWNQIILSVFGLSGKITAAVLIWFFSVLPTSRFANGTPDHGKQSGFAIFHIEWHCLSLLCKETAKNINNSLLEHLIEGDHLLNIHDLHEKYLDKIPYIISE